MHPVTYFECYVKISDGSLCPFQSYETLYWAGLYLTSDKPTKYCKNGLGF